MVAKKFPSPHSFPPPPQKKPALPRKLLTKLFYSTKTKICVSLSFCVCEKVELEMTL